MASEIDKKISVLEDALANNVTEVRFSDGKVVKYADPDQIRRSIEYFQRQRTHKTRRSPIITRVGSYSR